ncbi:MAG: DUF6677 family protein [Planctomycetaceae bacterium]
MSDPKINLKKPWLAGILTFFVPGAGHLYQGRYFKGILFLVCVAGTFLYGMQLGEWRPVYLTENPGGEEFGRPGKRNFGFLAQLGLGTPAILAYAQFNRYHKTDNHPTQIFESSGDLNPHENSRRFVPLTETIDAPFEGGLYRQRGPNEYDFLGRLDGRIELEPRNRTFRGTFKGTRTVRGGSPQPVELELGVELTLDSKVLGDPKRSVKAAVVGESRDHLGIVGHIPRGFANWFCAPLDDAVLQDLNGRLNKQFEMALVYTWIAGLLNILAIWDAVSGPAYGYSDEQSSEKQSADSISKDAGRKPAPDEPAEPKNEAAAASPASPMVEAAGPTESTGGPS